MLGGKSKLWWGNDKTTFCKIQRIFGQKRVIFNTTSLATDLSLLKSTGTNRSRDSDDIILIQNIDNLWRANLVEVWIIYSSRCNTAHVFLAPFALAFFFFSHHYSCVFPHPCSLAFFTPLFSRFFFFFFLPLLSRVSFLTPLMIGTLFIMWVYTRLCCLASLSNEIDKT